MSETMDLKKEKDFFETCVVEYQNGGHSAGNSSRDLADGMPLYFNELRAWCARRAVAFAVTSIIAEVGKEFGCVSHPIGSF